ncbi:NAD(P)-dependent alcohol dehydrogenase [Rhodococcus sp. IEGM 1379]|uniref:NAD(P)-dependent alcohol dehydrogenase n=1 Tax=Rhodococcus sp. IEGM 1379 TaxID=3047086 RepID=UPI0024B6783D|nr:NAD(P)-dependent alcohol dehydrogenase [Rhodococcus sp. IEGM 1379]MDI9918147.1 NAD(P)-dependent alcohol dehydrogenase [Rhodococcus sp. IEGM 1379]
MKPDVYSVTAAVVRNPGGPFCLEELTLAGPGPNEVLVRVSSSGICGTDLEFSTMMDLPVVLGHEGAGTVEALGSGVTDLAVGDKVTMTFARCDNCGPCRSGAPAYCTNFWTYNFIGSRPDGTSALSCSGSNHPESLVGGHFLGQSSFATRVVARRTSVVRVPDDTDLHIVGPFGCGFQTGAGAVMNVLKPQPDSTIAVFGVGGVGAAAVMAAGIERCGAIVAVDVSDAKLEQAKGFGATHTVRSDNPDLLSILNEIAPGGFDFTIDATGRADVLRNAVSALAPLGRCGVVGVGPSPEMSFEWRSILAGRTVTGITAGNSVPETFLPQLLELRRDGLFPVDKLLSKFAFADIDKALEAVSQGTVGKAVLVME